MTYQCAFLVFLFGTVLGAVFIFLLTRDQIRTQYGWLDFEVQDG